MMHIFYHYICFFPKLLSAWGLSVLVGRPMVESVFTGPKTGKLISVLVSVPVSLSVSRCLGRCPGVPVGVLVSR